MAKRTPTAAEPFKSRISGNLSPLEINSLISEKCLVEPIESKKKRGSYIFFTPHAWDSFVTSVHFGKWVPENELESQYFLEGYYFIDSRGVSSTVVTNIITPYSASQGKTSAQLYSIGNNAYTLVEQKESELINFSSKGKLNSNGAQINPFFEKFGPPIRVGFGHTHPNIGVFFSSVDKTSIFAVDGEPWITMVADPRREQLLAVVGPQMKSAEIVTYKAKSDKPTTQHSKKETTPTVREGVDEFLNFIKYIDAQLGAGCTAKIKVKGNLPGTLKFKGSFSMPRRKKTKAFNKRG